MANIAPNTLSTTAVLLTGTEDVVVGEGVLWSVAGNVITANVAGSDNNYALFGTLQSGSAAVITASQAAVQNIVVGAAGGAIGFGSKTLFLKATTTITIQNAGTITGRNDAIWLEGTAADEDVGIAISNTGTISAVNQAVFADAGQSALRLINDGTISSTSSAALRLTGDAASTVVINTGTIASGDSGGHVVALPTGGQVNNSGTISAPAYGIYGGGSLTVANAGRIVIDTLGEAVNGAAGGLLDNSGTIIGSVRFGQAATITNTGDIADGITLTNGGSLWNAGHIGGTVLFGGAADSLLRNAGAIDGSVTAGSGGDAVYNNGTIAGIVELGGGDDSYRGRNGQVGESEAGTGIFGQAGNDLLLGGRLEDHLDGGDGTDQIRGRDGDDILVGGAGKDTMSGGRGADTFVFADATQSGKRANADVISDFSARDDTLDLQGLGTAFIGGARFSGTAGEVRLTAAASFRVVQIDADGNGKTDSEIRLLGKGALTADDFLF